MPRSKKEDRPGLDLSAFETRTVTHAGPEAYGLPPEAEPAAEPAPAPADRRVKHRKGPGDNVEFVLRYPWEFEQRIQKAMRATAHMRRNDFIRAVLTKWLQEQGF